ncbi:hypothetical protein [Acinetobacter courvalinii]|uniref:hypothetical protein n=1 Tax=Acinetobacter courvalinii TaxID=280147 RepID=UPI0019005E71|nr:hypothetical protein [Acinetobacter courvalinii]MBJ9958441.1 hypothetical protein [Acinetobacter courvalinii]
MKKIFFIIIVVLSIFTCFVYANKNTFYKGEEGPALTKIESNSCYIYMFNNGKVKSILLAGPEDRSYFYFPCGAIVFSKKLNVSNDEYYVVSVRVRTSPQESSEFVRVVRVQYHDLIDENKLSYRINSCFSLEDSYSLLDISYLSYLISNKDKIDKVCDEDLGEIVLNKKINIYNFFNKNFSKKGYLIKDDKVKALRYKFVKGEFWLYISYGDRVKKWIKMNDIF